MPGPSVAVVKIMPDSVDTDLGKIEAQIKNVSQVQKIERKPIAFGLNAILATILVDEAKGGTDALEEKLGAIKGVSEVTIERVSLVG